MTVRTTTVLVAALVALGGVIGVAQVRGQQPQAPQILIESLVGRDSFDLYCASCHGAQGRGNGPVASALRATPADLSALALRNNGALTMRSPH
jgi:mono/diheme cytochrome c family protein